MPVDKTERMKLVLAMEFIARQINDEAVFDGWLMNGVADGDIEYGRLEINADDAETLACYIEDEDFSELMALFLRVMRRADKSGGLYCDGMVSK